MRTGLLFCGVLALPSGMVFIVPLSLSGKAVIQDFAAGRSLVRWMLPALPGTCFRSGWEFTIWINMALKSSFTVFMLGLFAGCYLGQVNGTAGCLGI